MESPKNFENVGTFLTRLTMEQHTLMSYDKKLFEGSPEKVNKV
jgi:hypothetical protein